MKKSSQLLLDLNNLEFQQQLFALGKEEQRRVLQIGPIDVPAAFARASALGADLDVEDAGVDLA